MNPSFAYPAAFRVAERSKSRRREKRQGHDGPSANDASMSDEEDAMSSTNDAPTMPRNPEFECLMRDDIQSQHAVHDRKILEQLLSGDTRALATLLLAGHVPGPTVRQCLALMLLDWSEAEAAVATKPALNQELWRLPFRLVARSRPLRRGRRRDVQKNERPIRQAEVDRLVEELGYDAAIARVNEAVASLINTGRDG